MALLLPNAVLPAVAAAPDDTVAIKVNGTAISGWTDLTLTVDIESMPRVFRLGATALNGGVPAKAGDPCVVSIGADTVLTGNIDIDDGGGDFGSHDFNLTGRGACADLVDCAAQWPGGQISGSNALAVTSKLAQAYNISAYAAPGADLGPVIPQFNLNFGEKAFDIIERVTAFAGLLAYEDAAGKVVLSQVGTTKAASGAVYGQNVLKRRVTNSLAARFASYACSMLPVDTMGDIGGSPIFFTATDGGVPRPRLMYIVADAIAGGQDLCRRRALWEAARRFGRGTKVEVTVDSWRDSAGALWTPNTLVPVSLPELRTPGGTADMLLSRIVFRYGAQGKKLADLTLMPPAAFQVLQVPIVPVAADLTPSSGS